MSKSGKAEQNGLNIIIVGAGKVGIALTEQLSKEGHAITVIDISSAKIREITGLYDVMGITGNGASYTVLDEAGISDADLLIAVSGSDELNLLCCTVASRSSKCAVIARVRTPDYSRETSYLRDKLGLAMIINPELEAAREAARMLYLPSAIDVNSFAHGQAELIKFKVPEGGKLDGITIAALGWDSDFQVLIAAVERDGEVYIPSGSFRLMKDDIVSFVTPRARAKDFFTDIGLATAKVKDVMIIGGGRSAFYLATNLLRRGLTVKIIEIDPARCEELAILLPKAIVLNGDGTDEDLLKEEGIERADGFCALTGIDEENILLTLHARNVSDAKVITKINRINFKDAIAQLDLGSVLYPRYIATEAIVAYVRARYNSTSSNIETLYHLYDHRVEAIEFRVGGNTEVTGVPIMQLPLKEDLLISFINRAGKIIIPRGHDTIEKGDTVMIVTKHSGFTDINDILR